MFAGSFEKRAEGTWLLARFCVRDWVGAWCQEEAQIWSREGQLLAAGHQMRRVFV
jgi:hypothetical protein